METEKREVTGRINGRFAKGFSGNPGGRPKKLPELAVTCREFGPEIVDAFIRILRDESEKASDRLTAGRLLLEYGFGKPSQHISVAQGRPEFDVTQLSDEELESELKRQLQIANMVQSLPKGS